MSRICFFSGDITRNGGTERVSVMIANELVKDPGYEILILSLVEQKEKPFYEVDDRIKRFALGNRWLTPGPEYLPLIPKLRSFLKQREIDIIIDIDIVLDVREQGYIPLFSYPLGFLPYPLVAGRTMFL